MVADMAPLCNRSCRERRGEPDGEGQHGELLFEQNSHRLLPFQFGPHTVTTVAGAKNTGRK